MGIILIAPLLCICISSILSFFISIFRWKDSRYILNVDINTSKSARYTLTSVFLFVLGCFVVGAFELQDNNILKNIFHNFFYVIIGLSWWWIIETGIKAYKEIKTKN